MCTCRGIVIADDDGNPQYFGGAIRNHNKQSYIDSLTGLRNQYGFFSDLQSYIKNKIPIRIGMAGIGKLTEVNEVYGYHVGNKILQHFGRFLMDNVTLRAGGVRVALDDFGTGFSSVGLVKNLPFDTIKIDRSFVQQIEQDEREKKLLNNFTDIAGIFGADVCVEGIETTGMCDIIRDYGIHSFQGYYYSKPIPIDELLDKVKSGADCFAR